MRSRVLCQQLPGSARWALISLSALLALAGCDRSDPAVSEGGAAVGAVGGGAATPAAPGARPAGGFETWIAAARAPWTPAPDGRLVGAIGVIDRASGNSAETRATRFATEWRIMRGDEQLAVWPSYVSPDVATALMAQRVAITPGEVSRDVPSAADAVQNADPAALLAVIDALGDDAFVTDPELTTEAAEALSALVVLSPRDHRAVDELAQAGLAVCVIGTQAHGLDLAGPCARLWYALGYRAHARHLAASLPPSPERSWLLGDDAGLAAAAELPDATPWVRFLATTRRSERFESGMDISAAMAARGGRLDSVGLSMMWDRASISERRMLAPMWSGLVADAVARELRGESAPGRDAASDEAWIATALGAASARPAAVEPPGGDGIGAAARRAWAVASTHDGWRQVVGLQLDVLSLPGEAGDILRTVPDFDSPAVQAWNAGTNLRVLADGRSIRHEQVAEAFDALGPIDDDMHMHLLRLDNATRPVQFGGALDAGERLMQSVDGRPDMRPSVLNALLWGPGDFVLATEVAEALLEQAPGLNPFAEMTWLGMEGDTAALRTRLDDTSRSLSERVKAAELLLSDAAGDTELVAALLALAESAADDAAARSQLSPVLIQYAPAESTPLLTAWLQIEDGSAIARAAMAARLAKQHREQGRAATALDIIEPWVPVYSSAVLYESAMCLAELGRVEDARQRAAAGLDRYPGNDALTSVLVMLDVRDGDYDGAADRIRELGRQNAGSGMNSTIARSIVRGMHGRDADDVETMIARMMSGGRFGAAELSSLASSAAALDRRDIAFAVYSRTPLRNNASLEAPVRAWRHMNALEGREAATAWFNGYLTPEQRGIAAMWMHRNRAHDLLWDALPLSDDAHDRHTAYNQILRAAAVVAQPDRPERAAVEAYFAAGPDDHYHRLGRYLVDQADQASVTDHLRSADERAEAAYFIGWKLWYEGQQRQAAEWFRIAYDTGAERMGEMYWAWGILRGYVTSEHTPARMEREAEAPADESL